MTRPAVPGTHNGQEGRATWPLGAEPRTCPTCGLTWPREDDDPDTDQCASHRGEGRGDILTRMMTVLNKQAHHVYSVEGGATDDHGAIEYDLCDHELGLVADALIAAGYSRESTPTPTGHTPEAGDKA